MSKILVGHRPTFQKWLLTNQFNTKWSTTDQVLKNGCSPTNFEKFLLATDHFQKNRLLPTKFSKMVGHRPLLKEMVGHQPTFSKMVAHQPI